MNDFTLRSNYKKPFTWSYSALKNFETCPRKHYYYGVSKKIKEEKSAALTYGFEVHDAMAKRLKGEPLPSMIAPFEPWAVKFLSKQTPETRILVEQDFGLDREFRPIGYWDKSVWYRAKGDAVRLQGQVALYWDWKTGSVKEDAAQLLTAACCIFAHYPQIMAVRGSFIWLDHGDAHSDLNLLRHEVPAAWATIMPRVAPLEQAYMTDVWLPKPSGLCKRYCDVVSCEYHGVGG